MIWITHFLVFYAGHGLNNSEVCAGEADDKYRNEKVCEKNKGYTSNKKIAKEKV